MKKIFFRCFLSFSVCSVSAQTYLVPGAQVQPAWVFPLWFEDGSGDKDTLYFCYDPSSNDQYPSGDTIFGEKLVSTDSSIFWVGLSALGGANLDTTRKVYVSNQPFTLIFFHKGIYPLKFFWDDTLFYSSSLPYPDLSPFPRARISIICSDAFGNCPSDIELSMTAINSSFPFPLIDSAVFEGLNNVYVGNTLGEFSIELRPFDSPLEDAVINLQSKNITIYPTITHNGVWVESDEMVDIRVTDLLGRQTNSLHNTMTTTKDYVDLSMFTSGYYLFLVKTSGTYKTLKILKL